MTSKSADKKSRAVNLLIHVFCIHSARNALRQTHKCAIMQKKDTGYEIK